MLEDKTLKVEWKEEFDTTHRYYGCTVYEASLGNHFKGVIIEYGPMTEWRVLFVAKKNYYQEEPTVLMQGVTCNRYSAQAEVEKAWLDYLGEVLDYLE